MDMTRTRDSQRSYWPARLGVPKRSIVALGLALLAMAVLSGCASQPNASQPDASQPNASQPQEPSLAQIRYAVGPCYGTCPVYAVAVDANGQTRFTGERHTAVAGTRTRHNAAQAFATLRERLASWQPPMGATRETADCGPRATDLPHYTVTWTASDGREATLEHDSGCRSDDARALTRTLNEANALLGVESWVGR